MTQTMFNLTKHMVFKNLQTISSDMKAVRSNMKAKQWVLNNANKIPRQAQIDSIESMYDLDYHKYFTLCCIYAVVKHTEDEEAAIILNKYPLDRIMLAISEELHGTKRFEKVLETFSELMDVPEIEAYRNYNDIKDY